MRAGWATVWDDLVLSGACLVGMLVVVVLLVADLAAAPARPEDGGAALAVLSFTNAEVRRRPRRTLVWDLLRTGDAVRRHDTVFVPPGSSAVFAFTDGTRLEIDQNSLVVIEQPAAENGVAVSLVRGTVFGESGGDGLEVRTGGGTARLAAGARANLDLVDGTAEVDVIAGTAALDTAHGRATVTRGRRHSITGTGELAVAAEWSARLLSPDPGARVFLARGAAVSLRWEGAARVEVASSRRFRNRIATGDGGELGFVPPVPGVYYWRAVGERGGAASETRKIVVVEDLPPKVGAPNDETVLVHPGGGFMLTWSAVPGVRQYVVELDSDGADFSDPAVRVTVRATHHWLVSDLPEGYYRWRVRADEAERGRSPFSDRGRFRLIAEALPDAPRLLDPEFHLERR